MNCLWTRGQLQSVRWCRRAILRESGIDIRIDLEKYHSFLSDCYVVKVVDGRSTAVTPGQVLPLVRLMAHIATCASMLAVKKILQISKGETD